MGEHRGTASEEVTLFGESACFGLGGDPWGGLVYTVWWTGVEITIIIFFFFCFVSSCVWPGP